MIAFPDPWSFMLGHSSVILVSDQQLIDLARDPDRPVNLSLTQTPRMETLRKICQRAQAAGHRTLSIAFDYFWAQYRTEVKDEPRRLWPDEDDYIQRIGQIGRFARQFGLGIELSLLSPLEIGHAYQRKTGESGRWLHYREGLRDPGSGDYSVQLWRQQSWTNNKGTIRLSDQGMRVFAFRERPVPGTPYHVVDPREIVEISETAQVEVYDQLRSGRRPTGREAADPAALAGYSAVRIRVHGQGRTDVGPLNRVLVVQQYGSPEMDYFSDSARPFLHGLIDQYCGAGVRINAIYADETHIQGDWTYFRHHDHGELAVRYVSPGLERMFADRFGSQYGDFAKWLVYFTRGQHDTANDLTAKSGAMHVLGPRPADIQRTALLRARYYELLQNHVVDLFVDAKRYLEQRMGHQIHSRAHATWAESPTIDDYRAGQGNAYAEKYEYTSSFVWSNTVHQASSACYDYFKWGEFLHGTGNDTAECGWLDRNYWGFALASSLGVLNRVRNAYAAHWGMPAPIARRRAALRDAWGTWPSWPYGLVQNMEHREVEVLMLYPLDLVAVDERFGSWMTQYAYANWITQAKLLERGRVVNGQLDVAGRRYTTLVATFQPFPRPELVRMMEQLVAEGGRVVWSGPPPLLGRDGHDVLSRWQKLTGVQYQPTADHGTHAAGRLVRFAEVLGRVEPMTILTDLLPDRVYPVRLSPGTQPVARIGDNVVGTHRSQSSGGTVTFLGFRPRDDQSMMTGRDERHWFDILRALGCYEPTSRLAEPNRGDDALETANDNTEYVSRTTDYFAARFPNGTISIAPHLRHVVEQWDGGFHRNRAADERLVRQLQLPSERIELRGLLVNGHTVRYAGQGAVAFRVDAAGALAGFAGRGCDRIDVDGRETVFADRPMPLVAWAPVPKDRQVLGGASLVLCVAGAGKLRIPAAEVLAGKLYRQGKSPGKRGPLIDSRLESERLAFESTGGQTWYYLVPND